ncbi:hypothetical protein L484_016247 [Morus notabilis]|uniref:Uncharacterized protein n=1 Tax=Morus notabilis TaxID=981085 RepID=W9QSS9_9ROSA|nr:hypothetical protein L484_016247 [Morus notabilis]
MRRVHPRGQNSKLGPGRRGTWLGRRDSRPLMSSVIKIILGETDVKSAAISSQGAASTSGASTMDDLLPATWAYLKNLNNDGQE